MPGSPEGREEDWLSSNARLVSDAKDESLYCEGTIGDITARKEAEDALLASQLKLSEAMDLARIVNWEVDLEKKEFIFNDSFYAFYGTTAEREGGYRMSGEEYCARFVHPEDRLTFARAEEKLKACTEAECRYDVEHRIIRGDAEVRDVLARVNVSKNAAGLVIRCYGANQDITERKRRENELLWETTFLQTLLDSSQEGILVLDRRRQKLIMNRKMIDMWKIRGGSG